MVATERTGDYILETLLDDDLCRARTYKEGTPFLLPSAYGVHVVQSDSRDARGSTRAEYHTGQLAAVLGLAGVAGEADVRCSGGKLATVKDIIANLVMRHSNDDEAEFIATAFALWIPGNQQWHDRFGQMHSFDKIASKLVGIPFGDGACGGTHVPYAVALTLYKNSVEPTISDDIAVKCANYLSAVSRVLERTQLSSGGWDENWPGSSVASGLYGGNALDMLNITGHHLEWITLAPREVRPHPSVINDAILAVGEYLRELPPHEDRSFKTLLPVSYAARALCSLRGEDPYQSWVRLWKSGVYSDDPRWVDAPKGRRSFSFEPEG
ncbi:MAG: hypothetical protein AAF662_04475 [Pseudomonadota bacterium]